MRLLLWCEVQEGGQCCPGSEALLLQDPGLRQVLAVAPAGHGLCYMMALLNARELALLLLMMVLRLLQVAAIWLVGWVRVALDGGTALWAVVHVLAQPQAVADGAAGCAGAPAGGAAAAEMVDTDVDDPHAPHAGDDGAVVLGVSGLPSAQPHPQACTLHALQRRHQQARLQPVPAPATAAALHPQSQDGRSREHAQPSPASCAPTAAAAGACRHPSQPHAMARHRHCTLLALCH